MKYMPRFMKYFCAMLMSSGSLTAHDSHTSFHNEPDQNGERRIVIVTASYNNKDWYQWNLDSVFGQKYQNYHLMYIDDCSTDGTPSLVEQYIKEKGYGHKVTLIKNEQRRGAVANHYHAIHSCNDKDIIINLDGDDRLAHAQVLAYINTVYSDDNVWLTYGQFMEYPNNAMGFCCQMPEHVIRNNSFRDFTHIPSHMRTFYAGLYKHIKKEDLMYDGQFLEMLADIAAIFPMIEMARDHFKFIPEILYIYNGFNPLNDHKKSKKLQRDLDIMLRAKQRYEKIKSPIFEIREG